MKDARIAANYCHEYLFPVHRGVLEHDDSLIVFWNRGEPTQVEIDHVRSTLAELDLKKETGFAASDGGYSWALSIENYKRVPAYAALHHALWEGYRNACAQHRATLQEVVS